jgi:hypothetical protein
MSTGRIPKPYINDVPKEGDTSMMVYTLFPTMGIGARRSGMPQNASAGPKSIEHVGGSTGQNSNSGRK